MGTTKRAGRVCWWMLGAVAGLRLLAAQAPVPAATTGAAGAAHACEELRRLAVAADAIGLPTRGARVTHASHRRFAGVAYCKVSGEIAPVDSAADAIEFEVNLPDAWNGKAAHFGGAVFDGWLGYSNGRRGYPMSPKGEPSPLSRGWVTFGSDGGHHRRRFLVPGIIRLFDSTFAVSAEEEKNFKGDALKKTHDVALAIVRRRYGSDPTRMLFLGASVGGHEALEVVERWPGEYNGVLSGYPAWNGGQLALQFIRVSQAQYAKGGFLSAGKTKMLARAVERQCDALDGVRDGLIANVRACHFDPATLRCSAQHKHGCLTEQQLATVRAFATEQRTVRPMSRDVDSIPAYNVLAGADLTGTQGWFAHAHKKPRLLLNSLHFVLASRVVRDFVVREPNADLFSVDPGSGAPFTEKFEKGAKGFDTNEDDLSPFATHGGKLLLVHGTADPFIPTGSTEEYYERVRRRMGPQATDAFLQLYLIPGFAHGEGRFNAGFDAVGTLDHWLDTQAIGTPVVTDKNRRGHGRARPMCAYPGWAQYTGTGDVRASASYRCVTGSGAAR